VRAYKGGGYSRVYGTAINELKKAISDLEMGKPPTVLLCKRLRDKQEYLHATYAEKVFILPKDLQDRWEEFPEPIYRDLGTEAGIQSMENRLLQTKRLVTKRQAEVEYMRCKRIGSTLFNPEGIKESDLQEKKTSLAARQRYENALRANSAVQRLLNRKANDQDALRLISEGFLTNTTGVRDISLADCYWIKAGKGNAFTLDDIAFSEDMFIRAEVAPEETMRVSGIPLSTILNRGPPRVKMTEARIGLWQVSKSQEEWADEIIDQLTQLRSAGKADYQHISSMFEQRREWVTDDTMIVSSVIRETKGRPKASLLLVSRDIRLAKVMAQTSGYFVYVISPDDIMINVRKDYWDYNLMVEQSQIMMEWINNNYIHHAPRIEYAYTDTGSFQASAARLQNGINGHGTKTGTVYKVTLLDSDYRAQGRMAVRKFEKLLQSVEYRLTLVSPNLEKATIQLTQLDAAFNPGTRETRYQRLMRRIGLRRG